MGEKLNIHTQNKMCILKSVKPLKYTILAIKNTPNLQLMIFTKWFFIIQKLRNNPSAKYRGMVK